MEADGQIEAASAVMLMLHPSVVVKRELSVKEKLSIYWSIYIPILTYGHELWVVTERSGLRMQETEMSFLHRVACLYLRDRLRSAAIQSGHGSSSELQDGDQQITNETIIRGENASSVETQTDQELPNKTTTTEEEEKNLCNFQAIADHLELQKDSIKYTLSRPVKYNNRSTEVFIFLNLYAILDMREIDQTFVSYIWVSLMWNNELISWNPDEFCGIKNISIPIQYMWMPDIVIEEMTEKDKAAPSPYLFIHSEGGVYYKNDQVVVSTCKMHVYKFPFDIQSCNLSFKSVLHDDSSIFLRPKEKSLMTLWFDSEMHTQYEWVYINMTITIDTACQFGSNKTRVIYTIYMKRRSVHYLANFILPILFFLVLDLASFLISDSGGEKLSFKVTVLLAVTVMQLVLNDILPSSSDSIPLIVVYCIGIFALMLLSVLETILMMHLIEKDSAAQDDETDGERSLAENSRDRPNFHSCFREMKRCNHCASSCEVSADEETSVCMSSVTQKDSSSKLTEVSSALEKVSDELWETRKTVTLLSSSSRKPGYWTRMVKKINKIFAIFYLTVVTVFLTIMASLWAFAEDD
ncbi:5-hydroxytryptamine receptor 3A-like [Archocentrus centrarchus]|uniref:5-hydroxytryptamine receptor 3A-like n=1 Tax=Archocentrus centrarchus TaxID=63155 RepID=UPI0011EA0F27|nr:5-hydroxytryptamine receptor 3A-like [Archocentrus centrarchus]